MLANLKPINSTRQPSAQHTATWMFLMLLAVCAVLGVLLIAILFMFAETLLPHVVDFCLTAWHELSIQLAYRLMFLGLTVLLMTGIAFFVRLWRHAHLTEQYVRKLLLQKRKPPALFEQTLNALSLSTRVDLVAAPQPFAFSYGWRMPRVVVTTGLLEVLDEQELQSVLAHEKYHLIQHDPFKILVTRALRDTVIFFPLLKDLVENYLLLQEIAADQTALAAGATRETLASALLKVFRSPKWDRLGVGAYTPLGERVEHLANPQRRFVWRVSFVRAVISIVAGILLLLAVFHPMVPMALGEGLHANCNHGLVGDIETLSVIHT